MDKSLIIKIKKSKKMSINQLARRTEVQVIAVFGVVALTTYYFWLKKKKTDMKWASK